MAQKAPTKETGGMYMCMCMHLYTYTYIHVQVCDKNISETLYKMPIQNEANSLVGLLNNAL